MHISAPGFIGAIKCRKKSIVLYACIFACVTALAVGVFAFATGMYVRSSERQRLGSLEAQRQQYAKVCQNSVSVLQNTASQIEYNVFVREWIISSYMDTNLLQISKILQANSAIAAANPSLDCIDIINVTSGKILSTIYGYYDVDAPSTAAAANQAALMRFLESGEKNALEFGLDGDRLVTLTYLCYINGTNRQGALSITGNAERMFTVLGDEALEWYAVDEAGGNVFSLATLLRVSPDSVYPEAEGELRGFPLISGHFSLLGRVASGATEVRVYEERGFYIAAALTLLACLIVSYLLMRFCYMPISRVLSRVFGESERARKSGDVIHRLDNFLRESALREKALSESVESTRRLIHEQAFRSLLFGRFDPETQVLPELFSVPGRKYAIAGLSFYEQITPDIADDVVGRVVARLGADMPSEVIRMEPNAWLLLVAYPVALSDARARDSILLNAQDAASDSRVRVDVYGFADGWERLPEVYERLFSRFRPQETASAPECDGAAELTRLLRNNDMDDITPAIERVINDVSSLAGEAREAYLVSLLWGVRRVAAEFRADMEQYQQAFGEIERGADTDWLREWLTRLCAGVLAARAGDDRRYKNASVNVVVEYLRANYNQPLSLNVIASELGMSVSYLSELIKKELGVNYTVYLRALRVDRAKQLLKQGVSVEETARRVGYDSKYSFLRNFKAQEGVTPSEYRGAPQ